MQGVLYLDAASHHDHGPSARAHRAVSGHTRRETTPRTQARDRASAFQSHSVCIESPASPSSASASSDSSSLPDDELARGVASRCRRLLRRLPCARLLELVHLGELGRLRLVLLGTLASIERAGAAAAEPAAGDLDHDLEPKVLDELEASGQDARRVLCRRHRPGCVPKRTRPGHNPASMRAYKK